MYLVSNPTSLSPQPLASPAGGLSLVGVGGEGAGEGVVQGRRPGQEGSELFQTQGQQPRRP